MGDLRGILDEDRDHQKTACFGKPPKLAHGAGMLFGRQIRAASGQNGPGGFLTDICLTAPRRFRQPLSAVRSLIRVNVVAGSLICVSAVAGGLICVFSAGLAVTVCIFRPAPSYIEIIHSLLHPF